MLSYCSTYTLLFSHDKGSFFSTRKKLLRVFFFASDGAILRSDHQLYFITPIYGASLLDFDTLSFRFSQIYRLQKKVEERDKESQKLTVIITLDFQCSNGNLNYSLVLDETQCNKKDIALKYKIPSNTLSQILNCSEK